MRLPAKMPSGLEEELALEREAVKEMEADAEAAWREGRYTAAHVWGKKVWQARQRIQKLEAKLPSGSR